MQVMWNWRTAVLAGALLCGACSKHKEQAPAPAAPSAEAPAPTVQAPTPTPAPEAAAPTEEPAAAVPPPDDDTPQEFRVGEKRAQVMEKFGHCAERRVFLPAGPGSLYVEIYQPKKEELCLKRLGERRFTIKGGFLHELTPGLIPPETPPKEKPEGI